MMGKNRRVAVCAKVETQLCPIKISIVLPIREAAIKKETVMGEVI